MARKTASVDAPWLEWAFGAIGAIAFAAIIAVLVIDATSSDAPPSIETRIESVEPIGANFLVTFVATNEGDVTAADVRLEATLTGVGGETEEQVVVVDFLPPRSERRGGFFFDNDPRRARLKLEAEGYLEP